MVALAGSACGTSTGEAPAPARAAGEARANPTAPSTADTAPPRPTVAAPDADEIPSDWVWVTDTKGGIEIAMPSLPRASSAPSTGTGQPGQRMLVATHGDQSFEIASTPVTTATAFADATQAIRGLGPVHDEAPWREHGLALTRDTPTGPAWLRMIELDGRIYALGVMGTAPAQDVETFFSSFDARTTPRPGPVHDPDKGYRVEAPARMGRWRDLGGIPPLVGHRGLLNGHQFSVSDTDLFLAPDPEAALDGAVRGMLKEVDGTLVETNRSPSHDRPSYRVELRAGDGMYATVRLVMHGTRLVQAAVYAPSGREAAWADAYVDSLVIED